jgi:hypothetical protein
VAPPVEVILFVVPLTLVTVPVVVDKVPDVGKVTFVTPVMVKVLAKAPEVVKLPPRVKVLAPLLTPVPPKVGDTIVPCQTPVPIVPRVVIELCPTYAAEISITGVLPPVEVIRLAVPDTLVTVPVVVESVPLVGNVTDVGPVMVKVEAKAPLVARLPARVKVFEPLFTPVPP